jgi:hypothetical protein
LDVTALYTNLPHEEGIQAMRNFLTPKLSPTKANMIAELTKLVLTGNIFEFNEQLFIQMSGTAMGTRMAPPYNCIFLAELEEKLLKNSPKVWRRYIDDIFCVINATEEEINQLTSWLNQQHETIKFTCNYETNGIPFLDTFAQIKGDNIELKPYNKPMDSKQCIEPTSCHPPHIFRSLPYSQALRLCRICTDANILE